ncbi:MAG: hypothetical protein ACOX6H_00050 [Christensenellales bacterium]|jgi:hypothetical protein
MIKRNKFFSFSNWKFVVSLVGAVLAMASVVFFATTDEFKYGTGTQQNPYKIYTVDDFDRALQKENAYIKLMRNIDFTAAQTISSFSSHFNLNGRTITTNKPIFNHVNQNAVIKNGNIKVNYDSIVSTSNFGFVAQENFGIIKHIDLFITNINITFDSENTHFGLLVGENNNIVKDVKISSLNKALNEITFSSLNIESTHFIGGIVGFNSGRVEDGKNFVNLTAVNQDVGGICGFNDQNGLIKNCINKANLSVTNERLNWVLMAGGISYESKGIIYKSKNFGLITAHSTNSRVWAGGIVGHLLSNALVDGTINKGNVNLTGLDTISGGGIVGQAQTNTLVKFSINDGDIKSHSQTASAYAGGISGFGFGYIENCLSFENTIIAITEQNPNNYISSNGGIAATSNGNIKNSISMAICQQAELTGGIIGNYFSGTAEYENNYWVKQNAFMQFAAATNEDDSIATLIEITDIYNLELYKTIINYVN